MIVCPLCEHPQAGGGECEVCGHALGVSGPAAVPVLPLEGLESTRLEVAGGGLAEVVPGLEPTRLAEVETPVESLPDLETARAAPVAVAADPVPGLERTEVDSLPGDGPTPEPALPVCRYCRSPALPGEVICGNCGMRLPVFVEEAVLVEEEEEPARCAACGTLGTGSICSGCGSLLRRA